jgi:hypothetical protein
MDNQLLAVILGFILTTVLGGLLGAWFQRFAWRRQAFLEQAKQAYAEVNAVFEAATVLIDKRYYALFKWNQALAERLSGDEVQRRTDAYWMIVADWNNNLRLLHNRLRIHLGERQALAFLDYADDLDQDDPKSLHYRFLRATRLLRRAGSDPGQLELATATMHELNWALTSFANDSADELTRRAKRLRALDWSDERPAVTPGMLVSGPRHPGLSDPGETHAAETTIWTP